ncbi:MAG: hypothetical protein JW772_01940 [Candidatus Diapherotrites archaeon]|nr:hypothetical protein [Candidatus Diapherotrites archaeon]
MHIGTIFVAAGLLVSILSIFSELGPLSSLGPAKATMTMVMIGSIVMAAGLLLMQTKWGE